MIHLIIEDRENAPNYIPLIHRHLPHLAMSAIKQNLNASGSVTIKVLKNRGAQLKFIEQTGDEPAEELPLSQVLNYVERGLDITRRIEREGGQN